MTYFTAIWQHYAQHAPFDLERLTISAASLVIELTGRDGGRLQLTFDFHFAARRCDESNAIRTMHEIDGSAGLGRTFYEGTSSSFLDWFHDQNGGIQREHAPKHFVVLCNDDVIDVIALEAPRFILAEA